MTPPAENETLVRQFVAEIVNGGDYGLADELFAEDYTRHDPNAPSTETGPAGFVETLKQLRGGFPDMEVHLGTVVADGDLVAFEGTMTGTHEGPFQGIEATGTAVEIDGNAMHRIEDGRIAETWATWNFLGLLRQVGAVEVPASPA
jgi:steroid delta-isomerase-like uncharacterized protein